MYRVNQSINQSTDQSINRPNQSINRSIRSVNQSINQAIKWLINQLVSHQSINQAIDRMIHWTIHANVQTLFFLMPEGAQKKDEKNIRVYRKPWGNEKWIEQLDATRSLVWPGPWKMHCRRCHIRHPARSVHVAAAAAGRTLSWSVRRPCSHSDRRKSAHTWECPSSCTAARPKRPAAAWPARQPALSGTATSFPAFPPPFRWATGKKT